jgi:hypothetical protein
VHRSDRLRLASHAKPPFIVPFLQGLKETGYVEGQNAVRIAIRPANIDH